MIYSIKKAIIYMKYSYIVFILLFLSTFYPNILSNSSFFIVLHKIKSNNFFIIKFCLLLKITLFIKILYIKIRKNFKLNELK